MIFEISDLDPKLKAWGDLVSKLQCDWFLWKFGNQNKLNMQIMNILIEIDDLDWKLEIVEIWSENWDVLHFLWNFGT